MANSVTTQVLQDGPRFVSVLLTGILDTSNEAKNTKITLSTLDPLPADLSLEEIEYSISGSLKVILYWGATSDVPFMILFDCGEFCAEEFGLIPNNAGAGKTGDVKLATVGWSAGTETYTILARFRKKGI
jgi:hypothetical protein